MVPKLHPKGSSFRGAAAYLLHDKGQATTAHRLAWTEVRNLATDNPQTAWKVMAATAMDQDRLKAGAGIKNTGRKSKDHVLHFTLSWHPDESAKVSRDEMLRAAHGAIRALKADDHQALIVSHNDEPQAHVHILLNRVNPADGRILSSSKEKMALSRWAEAYEKERGRIFCEERVLNNAARDRGEFVRGEPNQARHLFEQKAANTNHEPPAPVVAEQKRKDAAVAKKAREAKARHVAAQRALDNTHRQRIADIRAKARQAIAVARQAIQEKFRPEWKQKLQKDQAEKQAFDEREKNLFGRVQNALKSINFGKIIRGERGRSALGEAFQAFAQAGARVDGLRRKQAEGDRDIQARQKRAGRATAVEIRNNRKVELAQARALYVQERGALELKHSMEAAALRTEWKTRREQREAAWRHGRKDGDTVPPVTMERAPGKGPPDLSKDFTTAAAPAEQRSSGGDEKAQRIEEHLRRMREAREIRKSRKPGRHL